MADCTRSPTTVTTRKNGSPDEADLIPQGTDCPLCFQQTKRILISPYNDTLSPGWPSLSSIDFLRIRSIRRDPLPPPTSTHRSESRRVPIACRRHVRRGKASDSPPSTPSQTRQRGICPRNVLLTTAPPRGRPDDPFQISITNFRFAHFTCRIKGTA